MHRALSVSEILREILLYASQQHIRDVTTHRVCAWHACGDDRSHCLSSCAYNIHAQKERPTPRHAFLLAAALSCKTFSGVALDLLWRVLDSAEPLQNLLKLYNIQDTGRDAPNTRVRYQAYASRVRGMYCGSDPIGYSRGGDASVQNTPRTKRTYTLPKLRSIRIDVSQCPKYQRPLGVFTSALTNVSLSFLGSRYHWTEGRVSSYLASYLHALTIQPWLDTLELDWLPVIPDPASLTSLPRLSTLRVSLLASIAATAPLIAALHRSSIASVRLFVEQQDYEVPTVKYRRMRAGGPVRLSVSGQPGALCLDKLLDVFAAGETELRLTCEFEFPDNESLADSPISSAAIGALARGLRCEGSTAAIALRAAPLTRSTAAESDAFLSFAVIAPLLAISRMTRFEITALMPFAFSDADIDALACAWPHLEALEMRLSHDSLQGNDTLPAQCPTLRSLISLSRHCRRLFELYVPLRVDADGVPCEDFPAPGEEHLTLRRLTIDGGEVLCRESKEVGVALQRIFPRAMVDTNNVFDMDMWNTIIQEKMRFQLYNERCSRIMYRR